jgi:arsenite methyltransferase
VSGFDGGQRWQISIWLLTINGGFPAMNKQTARIDRADYGIDAPDVIRRFFQWGFFGIALGCASIFMVHRGVLIWTRIIAVPAICIGCTFVLEGLIMLWGSKVGKLRLRDKLIDSIPWRGDEMVLDVGCGHGLLLIAAAKRLRGGKAIGIDLWKNEDQAENSREANWRNIQLENVADKVELKDGDAQKLEWRMKLSMSWFRAGLYTTFTIRPGARRRCAKSFVF